MRTLRDRRQHISSDRTLISSPPVVAPTPHLPVYSQVRSTGVKILDINPIANTINDLKGRVASLRGYL
jgi:hypothetical protein